MKAFKATVTRADGGLLIGGVTRHQSHPMETEQMARDWALTITRENRRALPAATFCTALRAVECSNPIMAREVQS